METEGETWVYLIKKEGKKERKKERNVLGRVYNVHSTHTTYSIQYSIYSTGHTVFSSLRTSGGGRREEEERPPSWFLASDKPFSDKPFCTVSAPSLPFLPSSAAPAGVDVASP
jgi:hypothetical protein